MSDTHFIKRGETITSIAAIGIFIVAVISIDEVNEGVTGTVSSDINKELFTQPLQTVRAFKPGERSDLLNELKLIEPALSTDSDRNAYKLLEDVEACQRELLALAMYKASLEIMKQKRATISEFICAFESRKADAPDVAFDFGFNVYGTTNDPAVIAHYRMAKSFDDIFTTAFSISSHGGVIVKTTSGIPDVDLVFQGISEGINALELAKNTRHQLLRQLRCSTSTELN